MRYLGTGPIRIGHPIPMGEDVYSMLFANCLNSDYFYYYKNKDQIVAEEEKEEDDKRISQLLEEKQAYQRKLSNTEEAHKLKSLIRKGSNPHVKGLVETRLVMKKS